MFFEYLCIFVLFLCQIVRALGTFLSSLDRSRLQIEGLFVVCCTASVWEIVMDLPLFFTPPLPLMFAESSPIFGHFLQHSTQSNKLYNTAVTSKDTLLRKKEFFCADNFPRNQSKKRLDNYLTGVGGIARF